MNPVVVILTAVFTLSQSSTPSYASIFNSLSSEAGYSPFLLLSSDIVSNCVTFDSEERTITITCKNSNLTQIDNQLNNSDIIRRDEGSDKGWI
ncbi:MAG: hypothetical protein ACRD47_14275 [Nitrososphaeraceae archaeon]